RSGSVARYTLGAFSAALRRSAITLTLPGITSSVGSKMFSAVTTTGFGGFFSSTTFSPSFAFALVLRFFFFFFPFSVPGKRIPNVFLGRSRTWPREALTVYSRPKYLLIVFAFAGDSTITSERAMCLCNSVIFRRKGRPQGSVSFSLPYEDAEIAHPGAFYA